MYKGADFHMALVQPEDAMAVHTLIMGNLDRFKTYFPKTVAANITFEKSKRFVATIVEDIKNKTQYLYTIKVNGTLAGLIYLKELDWDKKEGEFAYCIDESYAGNGLTTKAVTVLSNHAFTVFHLQLLKIIVHHSNIPSVRIAEKCNFKPVKTLSNAFTPPGGVPLDMQLFELRK